MASWPGSSVGFLGTRGLPSVPWGEPLSARSCPPTAYSSRKLPVSAGNAKQRGFLQEEPCHGPSSGFSGGQTGAAGAWGSLGNRDSGGLPSGRGPVPLTSNPVPSVLPWPRASLRGLCAVGAGGTDGVLKCSPEGGSFPVKKYVLSQSGPSDGGVPLRVAQQGQVEGAGTVPPGGVCGLGAGGRPGLGVTAASAPGDHPEAGG